MYKDEVLLIQNYISKLHDPDRELKKSCFKQLSYSKWAANEVLNFVKNRPRTPPVFSVETFASMMDEYACMNQGTSYIFSIAYDIAMDILDMLLEVRK